MAAEAAAIVGLLGEIAGLAIVSAASIMAHEALRRRRVRRRLRQAQL